MKINKAFKRGVSGILAAAIALSTLATSVTAASTGVTIGYTWDSSVNPTLYTNKYAASGGKGSLTYGEQIARFVPSTDSNVWAFCIEPGASLTGQSYGSWVSANGFTEYDTFDLNDKNKADTAAYWKSIGGTDGDIAKYLALVQYYGFSSHKNGNYFAATQCLLWEIAMNYRGHTPSTFATCSDQLWNDFTYPSGGWCTKAGVEAAYKDIVANVKAHYNLPAAMQKTAALAKDNAKVMKFNASNMRYEAKFTINSAYVDKTSLAHNFSTYKSALESLVKSRFKGTYGKDYGIDTTTSGNNTVYTVWSNERQFTSSSDSSIYATSAIPMQLKSGLKQKESLFCKSYYQTCMSATTFDPVKGYSALASYNEPNLKVEKTYTDSSNKAITATELNDLLGKTSFVISATINSKKYYVVADKDNDKNRYVFRKYTTSESEATKFKTIENSTKKGVFSVFDLPTSASSGRTYTVKEYSVPDTERYEKLSKSVKLPSPTSEFMTNAGTGTVKLNNNEESYDAKFGSATLDKIVENGDGKALSDDNESDIAALSDIYKSTKFIVGFWDGTTMRYLTTAHKSASKAFDGDLADLKNYNDTTYETGDGKYYVPTTLNKAHKVIFDESRTSTDISKAQILSAGYLYTGTDTCDYFGQIFLNLLPLDSSGNAQEIVFIEINGAKGYGYDDTVKESGAVMLSTIGSYKDKRNISGVMKNDTGKSYTITSSTGKEYVISSGKYYPISGNKLESNKLRSSAEIVNELVNYELILTKKDDKNTILPGATYGLYNSSKKLLRTAVTGNDGKAKFEYNLIPNTDYYVHEITAPDGYVLDTQYYKINRSNAVGDDLDNFQNAKLNDYGYEVKDKPYTLKIELNKYDVINNIKIEGITFDVSLNGKTVASIKTDKNGYASISDLPLGKLKDKTFENIYTVTERENDKYIMLDDEGNPSKEINIVTTAGDIESKTDPVITYTADIPNTLQLVDLKVSKVDEYDNPVKGVTFDLAPAQDIVFNGKTVQKKGEKIGTLVTDEKGVASSKYIEYATEGTKGYEKILPIYPNFEYMLTERSAPEPYIVPKNNVTRFIAKSDKATTLTIPHEIKIKDNVQTGILDVYKQDKDTKKPLQGAVFEVRAAKDHFIGTKQIHKTGDLICTMTTGADGHATSGDAKMYIGAQYSLTEKTAPKGYSLKSDSKTFTFSFAGNSAEYSKLGIDVDNSSQQGRISVHKTGDVFTSVNTSMSAIKEENGVVMTTPVTYGLVFTNGDLEGAVFDVIADEDIITADGTIRAHKGDLVAQIKTDKKGYAQTDMLYLGKYKVCEKQAAYGYINKSEPQLVELKYAGQEASVSDTVNTDFVNEYQSIRVHLAKAMERDETYGIGQNKEYTKVRFGLFADEKITAADGTFVPEGGLISELSLGEDMTAEFNAKIPFGKYYIQEIATDDHYILNGEKYLVTYEYAGQSIDTVEIDCGKFTNEIKRGSVKGLKVNEHDEPLANAVFGLFKADTKDFSEANAVKTSVSDENGSFGFDNIPYGKYIVTELSSPAGYVFDDKKHDVNIAKDGDEVYLKAINKATQLNVSKIDIYGSELKGALMQITDTDGKVFAEWTSNGNTRCITNIPAGSYVLKETASPDGYVIAAQISFTIDRYNRVTVDDIKTLSTDSNGVPTITMIDDTTKVSLTKLDITGNNELAGALMQIIDKDGCIIDEWTSTNESHYIEAVLKAGESYILHEVSAPTGYVLANDISFTVATDGSVDKVNMTDDITKVSVTKYDITGEKEISGAKLQVIDSEGNIIDEWISSDVAHEINGVLKASGEYTLHEEISADGYVIANDVSFVVDDKGEITKVYMYDDTTKVKISKRDITNDEELAGAYLQVIDKDGNIVDEWVSTNERHYIEALLISGETYTLHETIPAEGYVVADDVTFTVNDKGEVTEVKMYDDTTKVKISKRDITNDEELAGAYLQVIDKDGNIVDEWVSTNEPHYIEALLISGETYTLHETIPAEGYVVADDVTFTVNDKGEVTEVKMYDDTTKVHITKLDITTKKELPGAKLRIIDGETIVEEWTSTDKAHIIEGKLIAGKEYTLREITAPKGYEISDDIKFKVNEDGSVTSVVMYDEHTPDTSTHIQTPKTSIPFIGNPQTGFTAENTAFAAIAAALLIMIICSVKKKNNND